jgi:hypothetical protein
MLSVGTEHGQLGQEGNIMKTALCDLRSNADIFQSRNREIRWPEICTLFF